jgi:hypothetical protein
MNFLPNIRRRRRALAEEGGFAIIEAVVAALILVVSALAIYDAYDASSRGTYRAQQNQVELGQAQQEMERIRSLPYDDINMTSLPNHDPDPTTPFYRVQSGSFDLNRSGSPNFAPLVVNGGTNFAGDGPLAGGLIDPGPEPFQNGNVSGKIYRFVVWQNDDGCPQPTCTGQDIKRVIIVVQPDSTPAGGDRPYVEIHSDFINPEANSQSSVTPTGGAKTTAQQFWLSDTPCDPTGPTQHLPIVASHPLHNTLGVDCSSGPQTGTVDGAPDALVTTEPAGLKTDPFFDYQNDSGTGADEGIQMYPEAQQTPQCKWGAAGSSNSQTSFHVWMSDELDPQRISGNGPFRLNGPVSLSFFSRTVGPAPFPGKICIWLFSRNRGNGSPAQILDGTVNAPTWTWQAPGNWPNDYGDPSEPPVALVTSFDIGPQQIPPNARLGLAISVVGGVTPGQLELMYDHPLFPSVLSVDTTSPFD